MCKALSFEGDETLERTVRRHVCVVLMWFIEHDPNGPYVLANTVCVRGSYGTTKNKGAALMKMIV